MTAAAKAPLVLDSVTHLQDQHRGGVGYCGSHGGIYAAYYAAYKGLASVILNDAGFGRERAGVAGLELLEGLGVAAAAISHRSARIGDGADGIARGVISTVNGPAAAAGVKVGQTCREALDLMMAASPTASPAPAPLAEARFEVAEASRGGTKVIVIDSMSLIKPEDDGHIVISASHGGALGGRPEMAIKYPAFACVCNDADRGMDDAGVTRLPALDARGIAGACVSAFSARIGDGRSTWDDGYVSIVNETARRHGGMVGQSTRAFAEAMLKARLAAKG
ncbi:MAG: hypothetical protein ACK5JT_18965 [Hyphomicrobiaceae bacterium]